ncbi:MAG: flippase-like domain-containing protein [Muribaculaceae bacterium]|nr:flippase-like domain-containing protein [Muribaculaceae bacterium]
MQSSVTDKPTPSSPKGKGNIREDLKKALSYLVPAAVSAALIVWLFSKVHVTTIMRILREGCDYRWILLMCLVLAASRSVRGIRWGIQLRAAGVRRMPPMAEMCSIWGAYALNLILTYVGEAWRCLYVARRQKAPLSTVVGTDLGDRISDAIMILVLTSLTFVVARPTLVRFMEHYSFGQRMLHLLANPLLWIGLAAAAGVLVWLICSKSKNTLVVKIRTQAAQLWNGFRILFTMKHQVRFWSYTLLIWVAYFLMTYLCFFAFPFTRALVRPELAYGLLPGLVVFMFGSLSMAIPSSGGLGPWNLAVIFALSLYGVSNSDAATFAMVVWAFQTVTQIILGVICAGYVTFERRHHLVPGMQSAAKS